GRTTARVALGGVLDPRRAALRAAGSGAGEEAAQDADPHAGTAGGGAGQLARGRGRADRRGLPGDEGGPMRANWYDVRRCFSFSAKETPLQLINRLAQHWGPRLGVTIPE